MTTIFDLRLSVTIRQDGGRLWIANTAFFLAVHASISPEEITFIQNCLKQSISTRNKIGGKSKFQIKPFVKI